MKKRSYLVLLAPLIFAGCVAVDPGPVRTFSSGVVVARTPPSLRVETRTVSPGRRYVWVRGHWRWTGRDYDWVPGRWVLRPRPAALWVEGRWQRRPGGWIWFGGHWR